MEAIPTWFKYVHCIILVIVVVLPLFIYPVFKGVFRQNAGPKHSRNKGARLKFSCMTKYFLLIAVLFSYSYVVTTSAQTALMFVNVEANTHSTFSTIWCPLFASYRMFSYCSGRSILYCYFVYRTNDIFSGTYLQFSKFSKYGLLSWITCIIISLIAPTAFIYFRLQSWTIVRDENGNGSFCQSDDNAANYVRYIFMWGSLNDMTYSIITISMMVSRLFLILTDNERKKSRTKKYEYQSSNNSKHDIVAENGMQSPPESPRFESTQRVVSMSPLESNRGLPSPISGSPRADATFSFPDTDEKNTEKSKTVTKSKPRSSRKLKKRATASKLDAIKFHDKTHGHNKLILLISKFFFILSSVVISSQLVLFIFVAARDFVLVLYSMDTIINIVCLWLTFNFSDYYYDKYCCGRCCTACCFPWIKAIALTCSQYEIEYQQTHNMSNKVIGSKCCIYCRCCCFCSCRYGCVCCDICARDTTPKEIYTLAKFEVELIVASNDEKSVTMSQMSQQNHSQKDAMMSSVDGTSQKSFVE